MIGLESHLRGVGRKLLIPYVTGGITRDWTFYLLAYQAAGADAIEVGLPFSDPTVDGVTIQEASDRALERGATVESIFADVAAITDELTVPIVAMTYANLVVRRGEAAFCAALKAAGFTGLIVPDLPLDEISPLEAAAADAGIALVLLAAPSTSGSRLRGDLRAQSRLYLRDQRHGHDRRAHLTRPVGRNPGGRAQAAHRPAGGARIRHLQPGAGAASQ